jgi:dCMP deaminase
MITNIPYGSIYMLCSVFTAYTAYCTYKSNKSESAIKALEEKKNSWDNYFMSIAEIVKTRSPDNVKVGAVLVSKSDNRLISTGYNGIKKGIDKTNINWDNREFVKKIIIHAETNVLLYANSKFKDTVLYTTMSPCISCIKLLSATSVTKIYYKEKYKDIEQSIELCKFFNIELEQLFYTRNAEVCVEKSSAETYVQT